MICLFSYVTFYNCSAEGNIWKNWLKKKDFLVDKMLATEKKIRMKNTEQEKNRKGICSVQVITFLLVLRHCRQFEGWKGINEISRVLKPAATNCRCVFLFILLCLWFGQPNTCPLNCQGINVVALTNRSFLILEVQRIQFIILRVEKPQNYIAPLSADVEYVITFLNHRELEEDYI